VQRVVVGEADGGEDLVDDGGAGAGRLAGHDLGAADLEAGVLQAAAVGGAARRRGGHRGGGGFGGADGELLLHRLEGADGAAELLAGVRVVHRHVERRFQAPAISAACRARRRCARTRRPPAGGRCGAGRRTRRAVGGLARERVRGAAPLDPAPSCSATCPASSTRHVPGRAAPGYRLAPARPGREAARAARCRPRPSSADAGHACARGAPRRGGRAHARRDRVFPAEAGAAHRFRREGERQAEGFRLRPQRFRPFAALGRAEHAGAAAGGQQAVHLLDQDAAEALVLGHRQRSPSWRAMMPRRISRVPPRKE
jgi:hypothetical protein